MYKYNFGRVVELVFDEWNIAPTFMGLLCHTTPFINNLNSCYNSQAILP